jgi:hypothetical protein
MKIKRVMTGHGVTLILAALTSEMTAKWIAADCGKVKGIRVPLS